MDKIPGACNQQRLRRRILYAHLFESVNTQYYFLLPLPHCILLQYIISYWSLLPPACLNCVLSPLYHICTSTIPPHHLSATDTESIRFAFKRITVVTTHGRDHSTISLRLHFVAVILVSVNALSINTVNYCKHYRLAADQYRSILHRNCDGITCDCAPTTLRGFTIVEHSSKVHQSHKSRWVTLWYPSLCGVR